MKATPAQKSVAPPARQWDAKEFFLGGTKTRSSKDSSSSSEVAVGRDRGLLARFSNYGVAPCHRWINSQSDSNTRKLWGLMRG